MPRASHAIAVLFAGALGAAAPGGPAWGARPNVRELGPLTAIERLARAGARAKLEHRGAQTALVTVVAPQYDNPFFNFSLAQLGGYLRHKNPELRAKPEAVRFIEPDIALTRTPALARSTEYTLRELRKTKPHVIALSAKLRSTENLLALLDALKQESWARRSVIVVGNVTGTFAHTTLSAKHPDVLFALGEGELTMNALYRAVKGGQTDLSGIPNLAYRDGGELRYTERKVLALERQTWLPALDMLDLAIRKGANIAIETSRGCPGNCTYCCIPQFDKVQTAQGATRKADWRHFPIARTAELLRLMKARGVAHVLIVDSELGTRTPNYLRQLARTLLKQDNPTFGVDMRLDGLGAPGMARRNIRTMKMFHLAGLRDVFVGAESGSDSQLTRYGKALLRPPGMTQAEINVRGIDVLVRAGLTPEVAFLPFDPLMTRKEVLENLAFLELRIGGKSRRDPGLPILEFVNGALNAMRVQVDTPYLRLVEKQGLLRELAPEGAFHEADYLDPRMGQVANRALAWYREVMDVRYPILQVARYHGDRATRARARAFVNRIHSLDIRFVRAMLAAMPEDRFDRQVGALGWRADKQLLGPARARWEKVAKQAAPRLDRVGALLRQERDLLLEEMRGFLMPLQETKPQAKPARKTKAARTANLPKAA